MPSALPDGDPAPPDGGLPQAALARPSRHRPFGIYVHVPFCAVRCGYCDFNTYTLTELGARRERGDLRRRGARASSTSPPGCWAPAPPVDTVFVGGGTPTLLPAADLVAVLDGIRDRFGLAPDAEVTTEANPDSVTPEASRCWPPAGSPGCRSGCSRRCRTCCGPSSAPTTRPASRPPWRRAGAPGSQVSLDLIYGTPGESLDDWRDQPRAAASRSSPTTSRPTRSSSRRAPSWPPRCGAARCRCPRTTTRPTSTSSPTSVLAEAGYGWYEVSNWSRDDDARCRHNEGYWRGDDWWGIGPGAHSHVGGVRWWNVKHPNAYAARLADGRRPAPGRETLTAEQRHDERVLLGGAPARGTADRRARRAGARRWPGWSPTGWSTGGRPCAVGGWCSPCGAGSWPTPSCAGCWDCAEALSASLHQLGSGGSGTTRRRWP